MVERGHRRVQFDTTLPEPITEVWDGGPIEVRFPGSDVRNIHFGDITHRRLAGALVGALQQLVAMPGGPVGSYGSAVNHAQSIRRFDQFLVEATSSPRRLGVNQVTAQHVDRFETWTRSRYELHSTVPYQDVNGLIVLLRQANRQVDLDAGLIGRLRYVANGPIGAKTPLDAYPEDLRTRLRQACKRDISRVVRRLTVEGERVLAGGTDPTIGGWRHFENLVWQTAHGPAPTRQMLWDNGALHCWFKEPDAVNLTAARAMVHPSQRDLLPFVILLILESGLEIECIRHLRRDCLTNPTDDGFVDIRYVKRRAHGAERKTVRVRDGGRFTPGGLIRTVLRLTRRAADQLGSDRLWLHYGPHGLVESRLRTKAGDPQRCPAASFTRDHDITEADGTPLAIDFRRLRKSHKHGRYLQYGGAMPLFAVGHTQRVAYRHYADIPALRPAHDQAVADGLAEALNVATGPRVVVGTSLPLVDTSETPGGAGDGPAELWLATCSDLHDSPFVPKGKPCPAAFFNCLACSNAVVGEHKLPTVLSFLNFLIKQRARLDPDAWAARFGESYVRITEQILPQFPVDVVEAARVIAEADQQLDDLTSLWTTLTEGLP